MRKREIRPCSGATGLTITFYTVTDMMLEQVEVILENFIFNQKL